MPPPELLLELELLELLLPVPPPLPELLEPPLELPPPPPPQAASNRHVNALASAPDNFNRYP